MDYEQKYKEILEMAKKAYYSPETPHVAKAWLLTMFPTIAESEDEKIRKELIGIYSVGAKVNAKTGDILDRDIVAWLEKQGERNFDYEHADIPQKDFAPIEPKFKVGDWVVLPLGIVAHIDSLNSTDYQVTTTDGKICDFKISKQDNYRLWTIADAKDGDVLASKDGNEILIFRNLDTSTSFSSYYNIAGKGGPGWAVCFIPATKEQRDILVKAMANAGYTFDFEKKELKKIESKTLDPDKVIEWLKTNVYGDSAYGIAMIEHFKKDCEI